MRVLWLIIKSLLVVALMVCSSAFADIDLPVPEGSTPVSASAPTPTPIAISISNSVPASKPTHIHAAPVTLNLPPPGEIPPTDNQIEEKVKYDHPHFPSGDYSDMLPTPEIKAMEKLHLSLREAILLALRMNPSIQTSDLQRVIDKFNIVVAHNEFEPQYTLDFAGTMQNGVTQGASDSGVDLKTPFGTQVHVGYKQGWGSNQPPTASVSITQPLLRNFGRVNVFPYLDALDNDRVAKLTFKNNVIQAIVAVITSYRNLVQDYDNFDIQKETLAQAKEQMRQSTLQYNAGKLAKSEVTQVAANVQTTELQTIIQKNQIQQDYQTFTQAIGLVPTATLEVDRDIAYTEHDVPTLDACIHKALLHNIAYNQSVIQLRNSVRAVLTAENSRLPTLDATVAGVVENGSLVDGVPSPTTGPVYGLKLSVPIDDVKTQQALIDSRINLEQSKINLEQQKENLVRQVMTQWQQIQSQKLQIQVSKTSIELQRKSLADARLKLKYGRSTAFEVTQLQNNLLQAETNLIGTEISYLNDITTLHQTMGITLDVWDIKLRY